MCVCVLSLLSVIAQCLWACARWALPSVEIRCLVYASTPAGGRQVASAVILLTCGTAARGRPSCWDSYWVLRSHSGSSALAHCLAPDTLAWGSSLLSFAGILAVCCCCAFFIRPSFAAPPPGKGGGCILALSLARPSLRPFDSAAIAAVLSSLVNHPITWKQSHAVPDGGDCVYPSHHQKEVVG